MSVLGDLWSILPLPSFVLSGDDRLQAVNSAAENFLGASEAQLKGKTVAELFGDPVSQCLTAGQRIPCKSSRAANRMRLVKQPRVRRLAANTEGDQRDRMRMHDGSNFGACLVDCFVKRELGRRPMRPLSLIHI